MFTLRHAFPGQIDDEPVFILTRAHPLAFLPYAIIILFLTALSIAFMVGTLTLGQTLTDLEYNVLVAMSGVFSLFTILFATVAWLDFYFDIQIVTDRRIIDIDQNRLFDRQTSELNLEDIEDVSVSVSGTLSTLFNFGTVEIQTAGTRGNFHFVQIGHPREIASIISDLAEQVKNGVADEDRFPAGEYAGVIKNQLIKDKTDLVRCGALHLTSSRDRHTAVAHRPNKDE